VEILVYGLASFVLLIPVLYFLPLGISRKGKNMIAVAAGVFAIAGGYGNGVFNLGQMALIIILLIGTAAYIFDRKFGRILYIEETRHVEIDNGEDALIEQKNGQTVVVFPAVPVVAALSHEENAKADFVNSEDHSTLNGDTPGLLDDNLIETEDVLNELLFLEDIKPLSLSATNTSTSQEEIQEDGDTSDSELPLFDFDASELEVLEPSAIADPVLEKNDAGEEDYFAALFEAAVAVEQEEEALVTVEGARNE